jgi:hypothetical protein
MSLRPLLEGLAGFVGAFALAELFLRLSPRQAIALGVLTGLIVIFRRPIMARLLPRPGRGVASPAPTEPMERVLDQAEQTLAQLQVGAMGVTDPATAEHARAIAAHGERFVAQVRLGEADVTLGSRVLSYYLPRAAYLVDTWPLLVAQGDTRRQEAVGLILARMAPVFLRAAEGPTQDKLAELDVDLKLLDEALGEDLGGDRA